MKRLFFVFVWTMGFYFVFCMVIGALVGARVGARVRDPRTANEEGGRAAVETVRAWEPYLIGGALTLAILGGATGSLPGTSRNRTALPERQETAAMVRCLRCQALIMKGDRVCMTCGEAFRHSRPWWQRALFWSCVWLVLLPAVGAGLGLYIKHHPAQNRRDEAIGRAIGKALGLTLGAIWAFAYRQRRRQ
jgi:hypothetical protein